MNLDIDKDRAAFSEWAKSENFNTNWHSVAKFFTSTDTQVRWEVWQAARATPPAPTPAAAEAARDFDHLKLTSWTDLENYGEKFCEAFNAGVTACSAPLPRQAAVQEAPSEPVKAPMTYEQFMDEAERTGLTAGDLVPGVVVRLAEMEAQGVIRKHEDGGHEWVSTLPSTPLPGSAGSGERPTFRDWWTAPNAKTGTAPRNFMDENSARAAWFAALQQLVPDGWIDVEDRLPAPETDVFVRVLRGNSVGYDVAGIFHDQWMSFATEADTKGAVTHWAVIRPVGAVPGEPGQ